MSLTRIPWIAYLFAIATQVHSKSFSKAVMTLNPGQGATPISDEGGLQDHKVIIKGVGTCIPQVKCDGAIWRSSCKEDYVMISDPTGHDLYLSKDTRSGYWAKASGDRANVEVHIHKCPDFSISYSCSARCECSCPIPVPGVVGTLAPGHVGTRPPGVVGTPAPGLVGTSPPATVVAGADEILLVLGRKKNVTLTFRGAPIEKNSIDLYYLADYTLKMKPELGKFLKHKDEIKKVLVKYSKDQDFRFGLGLFVEKEDPTRPFDFSYYNVHPLNSDWEKGMKTIKDVLADRRQFNGGEPPQSQLDAIYQAAKCTKQVGWRKTPTTRIILLVTDCTYWDHKRLPGMPTPSACYLNKAGVYAKSKAYNYPSQKQIGEVLSANSIHIGITFALTQDYVKYTNKNVLLDYQTLTKEIGSRANIAFLDRDWSNLSAIIEDKYWRHTQPGLELHIEGIGAEPEIRLTYYSVCNGEEIQSADCKLVGYLDPTFIVQVELLKCPKSGTNSVHQVEFKLTDKASGIVQKRIKKFRLDCRNKEASANKITNCKNKKKEL